MARILSIDYGEKRTGIAITDPLQIIANGLDTIETHSIHQWLKQYMSQEEVETIIIGYPTHADGTPTKICNKIDELSKHIRKNYKNIKVQYVDESFSSKEAKNIILQSGVKKKKRREKGLVDKVAAVLLLQEYLEYKNY